jgi:hypothetical protein
MLHDSGEDIAPWCTPVHSEGRWDVQVGGESYNFVALDAECKPREGQHEDRWEGLQGQDLGRVSLQLRASSWVGRGRRRAKGMSK